MMSSHLVEFVQTADTFIREDHRACGFHQREQGSIASMEGGSLFLRLDKEFFAYPAVSGCSKIKANGDAKVRERLNDKDLYIHCNVKIESSLRNLLSILRIFRIRVPASNTQSPLKDSLTTATVRPTVVVACPPHTYKPRGATEEAARSS